MDESRRSFAAAVAALLASPVFAEAATQEVRETGGLSREVVESALKLSGDRMTEEQIELARTMLENRLRDFEAIRSFSVPPGLDPATHFKAR